MYNITVTPYDITFKSKKNNFIAKIAQRTMNKCEMEMAPIEDSVLQNTCSFSMRVKAMFLNLQYNIASHFNKVN